MVSLVFWNIISAEGIRVSFFFYLRDLSEHAVSFDLRRSGGRFVRGPCL